MFIPSIQERKCSSTPIKVRKCSLAPNQERKSFSHPTFKEFEGSFQVLPQGSSKPSGSPAIVILKTLRVDTFGGRTLGRLELAAKGVLSKEN